MKKIIQPAIIMGLLFWAIGCERQELESGRDTQPSKTENLEAGEAVEDVGNEKSDDDKTFIDYCFDGSDDAGIQALVDALKEVTKENLCGVIATKVARMELLDLSNLGLTDLRPLRRMEGVTQINLRGNLISDPSILATIPSLEKIDLSLNPTMDVSSLGALKRLTVLDLSGLGLKSLVGLEGLSGLQELYLRSNDELSLISPLSSLTRLKVLDLSLTAISSVDDLSSLSDLQTLRLNNTNLADLRGIANLSNLADFQASLTPILNEATEENCPATAVSQEIANFCLAAQSMSEPM